MIWQLFFILSMLPIMTNRYIVSGLIAAATLGGLAVWGRHLERTDLDYCVPARKLRWLVFKEEMKRRRRDAQRQAETKSKYLL